MLYNFIHTDEEDAEDIHSAVISADISLVEELYQKFRHEVGAIYTEESFDKFIEFLHEKGISASKVKTEQIYV